MVRWARQTRCENARGEAAPRRRTARRGRSALSAIFLLLFLSALLPVPFGAVAQAGPSPEEVTREIDRLAKSGRFQTELPTPKPPPPKKKSEGNWLRDLFGGVGGLAYYLLIGVLALAALYILFTLARQKIAPMRRGKVKLGAREAQTVAPRPPSAEELADAEAAALAEAAQGRYEEAIHLLLLGAIGQLREKNARAAARSLTSREILARVALGAEDGQAKAALRSLVAAVEISRFGGRSADAQDFERCLQAYRELRRSVGGSAAAAQVPKAAPSMSTA